MPRKPIKRDKKLSPEKSAEKILNAREALLQSVQEEQKRVDHLKSQQKEAQERIDGLARQESHLIRNVNSITERVAQLEDMKKELVDSINEKYTELKNLGKRTEDLDVTSEKKEERLTTLKKEVLQAETKLGATVSKIEQAKDILATVKADIEVKQSTLQEVKTALSQAETDVEKLTLLKGEIQAEIAVSEDVGRKQVNNLQANLREIEATIDLSKTNLAGLRKETKEEVANLQELLKSKATEEKEIAAKHKELDVRSETLSAVADDLRVKANKMKSKDLDKRISNFFNE